ncbi:MAG: glycosyltransferase [Bacteroidales bacterium]|nr:glycosyltransferase [Bacteroidales bacterium]
MLEKIIILVFWISFGIQIFYFAFFYLRVFIKPKISLNNNSEKPVSVIICAKNEHNNLKEFLPKVLNQKYPVFEVVVVNDGSSDMSSELLNSFSDEYEHLKIIEIKSESSGKKNAVKKGIEAAKYEYLLFTDADCYPETDLWIETMMLPFSEDKDIVLGYGAYKETEGFLNKMIRFETLFIALKYMSFAKAGFPYMGVGRNLAYRKSIFFNNNGFESHKHIMSGDDDLLINETANNKNTSIVCEYEGITKSIPKKTLKEFIIQKRRHLSTGFKYKTAHKFLLGTEYLSSVFFFPAFIIALIVKVPFEIVVIPYILKIFFQTVIFSFFYDMFKEKKNLIFIPIFDALIPIINFLAISSNFFVKNKEWK